MSKETGTNLESNKYPNVEVKDFMSNYAPSQRVDRLKAYNSRLGIRSHDEIIIEWNRSNVEDYFSTLAQEINTFKKNLVEEGTLSKNDILKDLYTNPRKIAGRKLQAKVFEQLAAGKSLPPLWETFLAILPSLDEGLGNKLNEEDITLDNGEKTKIVDYYRMFLKDMQMAVNSESFFEHAIGNKVESSLEKKAKERLDEAEMKIKGFKSTNSQNLDELTQNTSPSNIENIRKEIKNGAYDDFDTFIDKSNQKKKNIQQEINEVKKELEFAKRLNNEITQNDLHKAILLAITTYDSQLKQIDKNLVKLGQLRLQEQARMDLLKIEEDYNDFENSNKKQLTDYLSLTKSDNSDKLYQHLNRENKSLQDYVNDVEEDIRQYDKKHTEFLTRFNSCDKASSETNYNSVKNNLYNLLKDIKTLTNQVNELKNQTNQPKIKTPEEIISEAQTNLVKEYQDWLDKFNTKNYKTITDIETTSNNLKNEYSSTATTNERKSQIIKISYFQLNKITIFKNQLIAHLRQFEYAAKKYPDLSALHVSQIKDQYNNKIVKLDDIRNQIQLTIDLGEPKTVSNSMLEITDSQKAKIYQKIKNKKGSTVLPAGLNDFLKSQGIISEQINNMNNDQKLVMYKYKFFVMTLVYASNQGIDLKETEIQRIITGINSYIADLNSSEYDASYINNALGMVQLNNFSAYYNDYKQL